MTNEDSLVQMMESLTLSDISVKYIFKIIVPTIKRHRDNIYYCLSLENTSQVYFNLEQKGGWGVNEDGSFMNGYSGEEFPITFIGSNEAARLGFSLELLESSNKDIQDLTKYILENKNIFLEETMSRKEFLSREFFGKTFIFRTLIDQYTKTNAQGEVFTPNLSVYDSDKTILSNSKPMDVGIIYNIIDTRRFPFSLNDFTKMIEFSIIQYNISLEKPILIGELIHSTSTGKPAKTARRKIYIKYGEPTPQNNLIENTLYYTTNNSPLAYKFIFDIEKWDNFFSK